MVVLGSPSTSMPAEHTQVTKFVRRALAFYPLCGMTCQQFHHRSREVTTSIWSLHTQTSRLKHKETRLLGKELSSRVRACSGHGGRMAPMQCSKMEIRSSSSMWRPVSIWSSQMTLSPSALQTKMRVLLAKYFGMVELLLRHSSGIGPSRKSLEGNISSVSRVCFDHHLFHLFCAGRLSSDQRQHHVHLAFADGTVSIQVEGLELESPRDFGRRRVQYSLF
mmetsp:Transcript_19869/g.23513  ORF Transcript_19869/g.23513 Transcript_19869/m.23513 type:complete len:221 (+) Transcript_19869:146-808(+)